MKKLILELISRWKTESPDFWKNILKISVFLGTAAVGVLMADKQFDLQSYGLPKEIFTACGYIIAFCFATGLSAKITKKDNI